MINTFPCVSHGPEKAWTRREYPPNTPASGTPNRDALNIGTLKLSPTTDTKSNDSSTRLIILCIETYPQRNAKHFRHPRKNRQGGIGHPTLKLRNITSIDLCSERKCFLRQTTRLSSSPNATCQVLLKEFERCFIHRRSMRLPGPTIHGL